MTEIGNPQRIIEVVPEPATTPVPEPKPEPVKVPQPA